MTKEKWKKAIGVIGIPRLIVICFFVAIVITAYVNGIDVASYFSSTLKYWGMWGILVLAMVPTIKCGIGPNYGISLGIVGGLLGTLLSIEFDVAGKVDAVLPGFGPWAAFIFAIVLSALLGWIVGIGYGKLLNLVKGSEMTVTTYIGYSVIYLMCILWFRVPFTSGEIVWPLSGVGVRNSVAMEGSFGGILNNFGFYIGGEKGVYVPVGLIGFFLLVCFGVHLYFRSKTGLAITAVGSNPTFAKASGIDVDKTRIIATCISTVLAAWGQLIFLQNLGTFNTVQQQTNVGLYSVAAILVGGATTQKANNKQAVIGVILFHTLFVVAPLAATKLVGDSAVSEYIRMFISYGVIAVSLAMYAWKSVKKD